MNSDSAAVYMRKDVSRDSENNRISSGGIPEKLNGRDTESNLPYVIHVGSNGVIPHTDKKVRLIKTNPNQQVDKSIFVRVHRFEQRICEQTMELAIVNKKLHMEINSRQTAERKQMLLEQEMLHVQRLESLGVLAGGIAHDFNNMLTIILGNADLLDRQTNEISREKRQITRIVNAARGAADLCHKLLDYAAKGNHAIKRVDLSDMVNETLDLLRSTISRQIQLNLSLEKACTYVTGDAALLRQVILNLGMNAAESINGKGAVWMSVHRMQVDAATLAFCIGTNDMVEGEYICLEVRDTGCGMDTKTLNRIFEPFFTTKATGRGLGMGALLGIINAHQGGIQVESTLAKGTRFRVFFPLEKTLPKNPDKTVPKLEGSQALPASAGCGMVLIADDEPDILEMAGCILENAGYTILLAENGREAVDLFRQHSDAISLVVMDKSMPVMDGTKAIREIRHTHQHVPVLMVTGHGKGEMAGLLRDGVANEMLTKPYLPEAFLHAVHKATHGTQTGLG